MLATVAGRVQLYSRIMINTVIWGVQQASSAVSGTRHPLGWSTEQDLNILLLRTLFTSGTYSAWRNFTALWLYFNGKQEQQGLIMEELPADTFGVAGCRSSYMMSLDPSLQAAAPPATASCVLLYFHGGAFVAGEPRMYCLAFKYWMRKLAGQGIRLRVLSVGYPLSPEQPYPAAVRTAVAAYHWLQARLQAEGSSDSIILGGDSAGGNLVLSALACIRDGGLGQQGQGTGPGSVQVQQALSQAPPAAAAALSPEVKTTSGARAPPAGALLISPAVDFTATSVFGSALEQHFATLQAHSKSCQQQQAAVDAGVRGPPRHTPASSEWDFITVAEGAAVARNYVRAASQSDMDAPLVSPIMLQSFQGLVKHGMLLMYGSIEVMAPDIAAFADKVRGDGVVLREHAEAQEPHVYCVLPFARLLKKGADLLVPFIVECATTGMR